MGEEQQRQSDDDRATTAVEIRVVRCVGWVGLGRNTTSQSPISSLTEVTGAAGDVSEDMDGSYTRVRWLDAVEARYAVAGYTG